MQWICFCEVHIQYVYVCVCVCVCKCICFAYFCVIVHAGKDTLAVYVGLIKQALAPCGG